MLRLNLPVYTPKLIEIEGKHLIYDPIRKKNVALTPEEWVRQHFVNYLITEKEYPSERLANEVTIAVNGLNRRCDTVIYNAYLEPIGIIEYKSHQVKITQEVFEQIARYNIPLRVRYLIITNGLQHYCCEINYQKGSYAYLEDIPCYLHL